MKVVWRLQVLDDEAKIDFQVKRRLKALLMRHELALAKSALLPGFVGAKCL